MILHWIQSWESKNIFKIYYYIKLDIKNTQKMLFFKFNLIFKNFWLGGVCLEVTCWSHAATSWITLFCAFIDQISCICYLACPLSQSLSTETSKTHRRQSILKKKKVIHLQYIQQYPVGERWDSVGKHKGEGEDCSRHELSGQDSRSNVYFVFVVTKYGVEENDSWFAGEYFAH